MLQVTSFKNAALAKLDSSLKALIDAKVQVSTILRIALLAACGNKAAATAFLRALELPATLASTLTEEHILEVPNVLTNLYIWDSKGTSSPTRQDVARLFVGAEGLEHYQALVSKMTTLTNLPPKPGEDEPAPWTPEDYRAAHTDRCPALVHATHPGIEDGYAKVLIKSLTDTKLLLAIFGTKVTLPQVTLDTINRATSGNYRELPEVALLQDLQTKLSLLDLSLADWDEGHSTALRHLVDCAADAEARAADALVE